VRSAEDKNSAEVSMKRLLLTGLVFSLLTIPVSAEEKGDEVFNRLDSDNDGQVSREEFLSGKYKVRKGDKEVYHFSYVDPEADEQGNASSNKHKHSLFERLDADRNGAVNRREWQDSVSTGLVLFRF
jgi:Ca2+-binding EF-hand superfamily protein